MDNQFTNIYNGKKVFITGHTGFKGSWLSMWLSELGAEVIGYSHNIPTNPNHFDLINKKFTSVMGDILDKDYLLNTITKYQPDIVFHMAAQPLVRESYLNPVTTFETNIMGTVNLLESCRKNGNVKAIVNVTSDKCYQNKEMTRPYKESDPMGGHDPYSASKGCAELVGNSYRDSFFNINDYKKTHNTLLADVRAGNVIGGGDWAKDRLIPDIMKATSRGEIVTIRNPRATRPWQHVLEPLSGYLLVGEKLLQGKKEFADNWNFGPPHKSSLDVEAVVANIQQNWDKVRYRVEKSQKNPHEAKILMLDSSKAKSILKWGSVWNSAKTFEKTAKWYKEFYTDNQVVSLENLAEFVNDAKKAHLAWVKS